MKYMVCRDVILDSVTKKQVCSRDIILLIQQQNSLFNIDTFVEIHLMKYTTFVSCQKVQERQNVL